MAAAVGQDSVLAGSKKQKERRKRPCYELSPRKGVSAPLGTFLLLFQGFQQRGQLPENPFELSGICPLSCLHGGFAKVLVRFENHLSVCVVKNDSESPQHLGADDPCQVRRG